MIVKKSFTGIGGQSSVIKKQDVVSQRGDLITVMRSEYDCDFFKVIDLPENIYSCYLVLYIHAGGGFVAQKDFRINCQGPGDRHPLGLAA